MKIDVPDAEELRFYQRNGGFPVRMFPNRVVSLTWSFMRKYNVNVI